MDDNDLRALVGHPAPERGKVGGPADLPRSAHWPLRRSLQVLAVLIVLGSFTVVALLLGGALRAEPEEIVFTAPPVGALATPEPDLGAAPFEALRHLPAGSLADLELQSLLPSHQARPLRSYVRTTGSGDLTGIVFVDRIPERPFVDGIGVRKPLKVDIAGHDAEIVRAGPTRSYIVAWDDPELGWLGAWSFGTTSEETVEVVDRIASSLSQDQSDLPSRWTEIVGFGSNVETPIWRAVYLGSDGEVATIMATPSQTLKQDCTTPRDECANVRSTLDDEGVAVATFASSDRVDDIAAVLRWTSANNRRVADNEFVPLVSVPLTMAQDRLFGPKPDSGWTITGLFAHESSDWVVEPAVVLVERDTPEIGRITSSVVVYAADADSSLAGDPVAAGDIVHLGVERPERRIELVGWQHDESELTAIENLVGIGTDGGITFASRAVNAIGLERSYEIAAVEPFPVDGREGVVFAAEVLHDDGDSATIRVSSNSGFVPEAAAALTGADNHFTIAVRGHTAALVARGGQVTLSWQERPDLVISLTGTSGTGLVELAESLELMDAPDLDVDSSG